MCVTGSCIACGFDFNASSCALQNGTFISCNVCNVIATRSFCYKNYCIIDCLQGAIVNVLLVSNSSCFSLLLQISLSILIVLIVCLCVYDLLLNRYDHWSCIINITISCYCFLMIFWKVIILIAVFVVNDLANIHGSI